MASPNPQNNQIKLTINHEPQHSFFTHRLNDDPLAGDADDLEAPFDIMPKHLHAFQGQST
jgi:hypothetical protein